MQRVFRPIGLIAVLCGSVSQCLAVDKQALPDFAEVQAVASRYLALQRDYEPGDLITRLQVAGVLDAVEKKTAWKLAPAEREALIKRAVEERSFLAQQLTSKAGRKFSRQISRYKLGFDQLDRMSTMPQGRSTVERLVRGPDGYKLLEYMATADGGHELAKMLNQAAPRGTNFEQTTGRIYDEMQLDAALRQLHQAAAKNTVRPSAR